MNEFNISICYRGAKYSYDMDVLRQVMIITYPYFCGNMWNFESFCIQTLPLAGENNIHYLPVAFSAMKFDTELLFTQSDYSNCDLEDLEYEEIRVPNLEYNKWEAKKKCKLIDKICEHINVGVHAISMKKVSISEYAGFFRDNMPTVDRAIINLSYAAIKQMFKDNNDPVLEQFSSDTDIVHFRYEWFIQGESNPFDPDRGLLIDENKYNEELILEFGGYCEQYVSETIQETVNSIISWLKNDCQDCMSEEEISKGYTLLNYLAFAAMHMTFPTIEDLFAWTGKEPKLPELYRIIKHGYKSIHKVVLKGYHEKTTRK